LYLTDERQNCWSYRGFVPIYTKVAIPVKLNEPIHALVLPAMGLPIFDNLDLETVSREAPKRNRWDFLVTAAPAADRFSAARSSTIRCRSEGRDRVDERTGPSWNRVGRRRHQKFPALAPFGFLSDQFQIHRVEDRHAHRDETEGKNRRAD
jgi:hypothetical protein